MDPAPRTTALTAASDIGSELGLPLALALPVVTPFYLTRVAGRLALGENRARAPRPVVIDFGSLPRRGRGDPLARAVLLRPGLRVLDATAGLGTDAWTLACLGAEVTLLEREPELFALLRDALQRAAAEPGREAIAARMHLVAGAAEPWLRSHTTDVVYLDPMFPGKTKSALARKEMQLLQRLALPSEAVPLLAAARQAARERVVVKRPPAAPAFAGATPDHAIRSKLVRFDVYLCRPDLSPQARTRAP